MTNKYLEKIAISKEYIASKTKFVVNPTRLKAFSARMVDRSRMNSDKAFHNNMQADSKYRDHFTYEGVSREKPKNFDKRQSQSWNDYASKDHDDLRTKARTFKNKSETSFDAGMKAQVKARTISKDIPAAAGVAAVVGGVGYGLKKLFSKSNNDK